MSYASELGQHLIKELIPQQSENDGGKTYDRTPIGLEVAATRFFAALDGLKAVDQSMNEALIQHEKTLAVCAVSPGQMWRLQPVAVNAIREITGLPIKKVMKAITAASKLIGSTTHGNMVKKIRALDVLQRHPELACIIDFERILILGQIPDNLKANVFGEGKLDGLDIFTAPRAKLAAAVQSLLGKRMENARAALVKKAIRTVERLGFDLGEGGLGISAIMKPLGSVRETLQAALANCEGAPPNEEPQAGFGESQGDSSRRRPDDSAAASGSH